VIISTGAFAAVSNPKNNTNTVSENDAFIETSNDLKTM
jgi:hypothetical protein